ncbi:MAG: MFS transporter [Chloroflexota bacterium]|nr:MFS transporter [Chloroflexota bacterium]
MAQVKAIVRAVTPHLPSMRALRYPNFRWFWVSTSGQAVAQGMQFLILGWLVLDLTGSTSQLGLTIFFYGIPNLTLVLFGGIFADRVNRRKLLLFSQFGVTVIMFVVAALTVTDLVAVWQIYVASFLLGTLHAINMPTRLAMVVNLVEREDIMNAVVLNAAVMNAGRIIGPAVAGFVIDLLGLGPALFVNAGCYLGAASCVLMIRGFVQDAQDRRTNILGALRDGLVYFGKTPLVFTIVGIGFAFGFFGMPHVQVMPAFAREVLEATAGEAGLLITAAGVGSLLANVALAMLGNFRKKNLLLIGALLLFEVALFAFAWSHWFWVSWAILLFVGMGSIGYISLGTTVLQLSVPQELQGRVMSLWYVSAGFMFIGSLPMALVADLVSWPVALGGGAIICFAFTLWLAILRPTLRRLEV